MSAVVQPQTVRPVNDADMGAVGLLYEQETAKPGFVRWGYMDERRAAYLCCRSRPDRGTAFISNDSGAFVAVVQKAASVPDAEVVGPFPDAAPQTEDLVEAAEAWCRERGLRCTTWISANDEARRRRFEGRGYRREHQLIWMDFPAPPLARPYTSFRSGIELVDARQRLDDYFTLYNAAFERHLGDIRLETDDFAFRLADPCCDRSDFIMALVDGKPAGLIEVWADYDPRREQRVCWLTNIAIDEEHRDNLEIHLALLAEGASRMAQRRATSAKSLFDSARSQLLVLYSLVGGRLAEPFEFWAL